MQIITHPTCLDHLVSSGHPERPERLSYLLDHLADVDCARSAEKIIAPPAPAESILLAHSREHLAYVEAMRPEEGVVPLDPDTWLSPDSQSAATLAAGALCHGVDNLLGDRTKRVFCAIRPPGHHAETDAAMGFCIFNSVAIGALHALKHYDLNRIAILDFDVHHGNGTVEICRDHPDILVCSSFQHPFYPHRFFESDWPNIVNTPLPAGTESADFRTAIERDWLPALAAHQPDLILVSAGFDAHEQDPIAQLRLNEEDFRWITQVIVDQAERYAGGRVLAALEGGYDLEALATSVTAHLSALAD